VQREFGYGGSNIHRSEVSLTLICLAKAAIPELMKQFPSTFLKGYGAFGFGEFWSMPSAFEFAVQDRKVMYILLVGHSRRGGIGVPPKAKLVGA